MNEIEAELRRFDHTPPQPRPQRPLIAAARVTGAPIYDAAGRTLGRVADLVLDKRSGHVAHVLIGHGGLLGLGARHATIPWSFLSFAPDLHGYRTPCERADLDRGLAFPAQDLSGWRRNPRLRSADLYAPFSPGPPD